MIHNGWTPGRFLAVAAIASLACVAVAIGLAYPEPVPSAGLGPDWQCSRLALVWTSCTRLKQARAAVVGVAREPGCARRRNWS